MADELRREAVRLEQFLHGYSGGHRLLAGSIRLPQQDARTMLVLSDASGSGGRIPAEGYLTGYPLSASGLYVLARTWSAPEMGRPGCVWTHSVLIEFADLARIASGGDLTEHLRRPSGGDLSGFDAAAFVIPRNEPSPIEREFLPHLAGWTAALYGEPASRVIAQRHGPADDALVLAVWLQQWPRLRRSFRFCTQVSDDRSTPLEAFDLQLTDDARASRWSRVPQALVASGADGRNDMDSLLEDLAAPGRSRLRSFLREVGGDVGDGRTAMIPLVRLHDCLRPGSDGEDLAGVVAALASLGPGQGRTARDTAARLILSRDSVDREDLFSFALERVQSAPDLLGLDPAVVGRSLLRWRPELLAAQFDGAEPLGGAVREVVATTGVDELLASLRDHPKALAAVLPARPDLLFSTEAWKLPLEASMLFDALGRDIDGSKAAAVAAAMMKARRGEDAAQFSARYGVRPVLEALAGPERVNTGDPWVCAVARRPDELAAAMADGSPKKRTVLLALARELAPDDIPSTFGRDPWVTIARASPVSAEEEEGEDLLAALLFCRALGWRSHMPGGLLYLSVQRLHEAAAADRLGRQARRLVERRLPWVPAWREWDLCGRIRGAVVDSFLERRLSPLEFGTVVDDGRLWARLIALAAESARGRRFLEQTARDLRAGEDEWWHRRATIIDRALV